MKKLAYRIFGVRGYKQIRLFKKSEKNVWDAVWSPY